MTVASGSVLKLYVEIVEFSILAYFSLVLLYIVKRDRFGVVWQCLSGPCRMSDGRR